VFCRDGAITALSRDALSMRLLASDPPGTLRMWSVMERLGATVLDIWYRRESGHDWRMQHLPTQLPLSLVSDASELDAEENRLVP